MMTADIVVPIEAARSRRDYPPVDLRQAAREARGFGISTVAELLDVPESIVEAWELGESTLSRDSYAKYADLLRIAESEAVDR